jgi:hypothetical protein
MTPLLWVVYVANSITLFALVSWLPVLIEAAGLPRSAAALALSLLRGRDCRRARTYLAPPETADVFVGSVGMP